MKEPRICNRGQLLLLPQNMYNWLPPDHLAHFIIDTVNVLDLRAFYEDYSEKGGPRPYDSGMMVALLLYGYCIGMRSTRQLEQATWTDVAFRVISADQHPDHDTIAEFRKRHAQRLEKLFIQVLDLARTAGLLKMGAVSIDGTKIRASAAMSKRLTKKQLYDEENRLKALVKQILQEAEDTDRAEDELYGKGKRGDELPEHLRTQEGRLKALREAQETLAKESKKKLENNEPIKKNDRQVNVTDPDSRLMRQSKDVINECYNAQIVVDTPSQIIVAKDITQDCNDKKMFRPMMQQVRLNTQRLPNFVSADNGYFNEEQMTDKKFKNIQVLCPPLRLKNYQQAGPFAEFMGERLNTRAGRRIYSRRKTTVEPVFGQIKHNRGFRYFLLRGLKKVQTEWSLICTTHNLMKMRALMKVRIGNGPSLVPAT